MRPSLIVVGLALSIVLGACSARPGPTLLAHKAGDGDWQQGGRGVVGPVPEKLVPAAWPRERRTPENTGQVLLDIEVSETGTVERAVVTKSVSEWSDAQAVRTVKQWKYHPATRRGVPVAVRMKACVTFMRG